MFRRAVLLLLFLLLLLPVVVHAEENGSEVIYAYFRDARWLRSEPAPGTPTVANVPERTMLRLEPLDDKYAYTTYKGAPGYIYYKDYVTVKYTDPHGPDAVTVEGFFGAPVYMRQSPLKNASLVALLPTDERFQITFVTDEYAYIVYEGQEGYVYIADFVQMEYARGSVEPYISYVDEETPAMATPYYGAVTGAILTPYTPITVDGYDGDHVTILYEGQRLYAMAEDLTRLSDDLPIEHAPVAGSFAKGSTVTVYGLHGQFVHVTDGTTSGYIFFKRLKDSKEVSAARKLMEQEQERLAQQRFLNIAFSMLEEGTQSSILQGDLLSYHGAIKENLLADIFGKMGRKLYYFHKDGGLELDFLMRYMGKCTPVECKATTGNAKSMRTVLKHPEKYHVENALKLGDYNVGRKDQLLTLPLYMAFLLTEV